MKNQAALASFSEKQPPGWCKDFIRGTPVREKMEKELAEPSDYDASLTTVKERRKDGWVEESLQPKKGSA